MNVLSYLLILTQMLVAPLSGACAAIAPATCEAASQGVQEIGRPISACCATVQEEARCCEARNAADDRSAVTHGKPILDSDFLRLAAVDSILLTSVSSRSAGGSALFDALPAGLLSLQAQHVRLQV